MGISVADFASVVAPYEDQEACVATLLCDRHPGAAIALRVVDDEGQADVVRFAELRERSERLAAGFASLGIGPGDRVATLMGKSSDLVVTMLACWRLGAVYVPLFTAFGPQGIASRLAQTDTRLVVADADQRTKLLPGPDMPADGGWRIVVRGAEALERGDVALSDLADTLPLDRPAHAGGADWPLVHMLTSGTTGRPKGVVHPLRYVAGWASYLVYGLDVRPEDRYWSAADPGWAYGLYTAVVTPLALGIATTLQSGGFSAGSTVGLLEREGITNLAAAPTVYRALRAAGVAPSGLRLRCASSAGEPLTPEVNEWAQDVLGVEVRDHYGQTELGMVIGHHQHPELRGAVKPTCMGSALPGWSVTILADDRDEPVDPGVVGRLAVDAPASSLMTFTGYQDDADTAGKFAAGGRWYLTGDAAAQDADGDFHFSARDDDVIIMAGYRIGPFDIESVLAQHEAVAECAVIAVPDAVRGEVIQAVVVARPPHVPSDALADELKQLVKERYAAHAYPRSIRFVDALPKTPSGKVQRFVLRQQTRPDDAPGAS